MILSIKLLNLVGILVMATWPEAVAGSDEIDEDNSLKQALFLVGLLKSDFAKILRENGNSTDDVNGNFTEDANTTCPLPPEDLNSTIAMKNETVVTESVTAVSSAATAASTTATPNFLPPGAPVLQFSSWPPLPMPGYLPPHGLGRHGNFPDDYRFPYRFNRRRMMPDYYYYDPPVQRRANEREEQKKISNFRRQNIPNDDIDMNTATALVQTTTNKPSTQSEATTLHAEGSTVTSTTLSTIKPLFTFEPSTLPIADSSNLSTIQPSTQSAIEVTTVSTSNVTILSTSEATTQMSTLTAHSSILLTKPRSRIGIRTPVPFQEGKTTLIFNRNEKVRLHNADGHILRQHKTTSEKSPNEDIEMSQVASELIKEFKGTKTENITNILDQVTKDNKVNLKKKHRTPMKIYLKGSSRLPVPLPENNAFCYSYPHNPLCGALS